MAQAAKTKKIFDGRYEILSIAGRGARSVVYHARHVSAPHSEVALKVLLDEKGKTTSGERLRKEALAMVSSRHKYVVRLDDFHSVGSLCYLSMEYCPEFDLRHFASKQGGRLTPELAERFLLQIAEGLSFIHKAGIIHRDIKPDNILVIHEKEIRIADFGVAVLPGEQASLEDLQSGVGTMNYMAPEVLEGKGFDVRSDIYSLGVTLYEMLCGTNPFQNAPLAQQIEVRKDEKIARLSSLNPNVPPYLESVILQAMSFEREARFPSAKDLVQALLINRSAATAHKDQPKPAEVVTPKIETETQGKEELPVHTDSPTTPTEVQASESAPPKDEMSPLEEDNVLSLEQEAEGQQQTEEVQEYEELIPQNSDEEIPFAKKKTASVDQKLVDRVRQATPRMLKPTSLPDVKRAIILTVSIVLFLGLFLPSIGRGINALSKKYLHIDMSRPFVSSSTPDAESSFPSVESGDFVFPILPSGLYTGTIHSLLPNKSTPLTLLSFAERDELAFLIGLEGWKAAVIKPRADVSQDPQSLTHKPIRIASNGMVLELTGQNIEGEIFGYFRNPITGDQGEWQARPLKRPAANAPG